MPFSVELCKFISNKESINEIFVSKCKLIFLCILDKTTEDVPVKPKRGDR